MLAVRAAVCALQSSNICFVYSDGNLHGDMERACKREQRKQQPAPLDYSTRSAFLMQGSDCYFTFSSFLQFTGLVALWRCHIMFLTSLHVSDTTLNLPGG